MNARAILTKLHGRPAAGVPRWAVRAAYATTLTVLPSCLWRISAMVLNLPLLERTAAAPPGHGPELLAAGPGYMITLSVISEALAFLAVGLVCEWGETWPRWIPRLGGRPVPVAAAVVPAGIGATVLMVFPYALTMIGLGRMVNGHRGVGLVTHGWQTVTFWASYLPLAAWGPLLAVLTVHYHRRRTARPGRAGVALAA